jgi:hypothetical protein
MRPSKPSSAPLNSSARKSGPRKSRTADQIPRKMLMGRIFRFTGDQSYCISVAASVEVCGS